MYNCICEHFGQCLTIVFFGLNKHNYLSSMSGRRKKVCLSKKREKMRRLAAFAPSLRSAVSMRLLKMFTGDVEDFKKATGTGSVIVDFYAEWCGPCKMIAPVLEELSKKNANISFLKANVEENDELAAMFNVRSIPTFVGFKDGKQVATVEGASQSSLEGLIDKVK